MDMNTIKNNLEQYLNWLSGADDHLTDAELADIKSVIFSPEADEIHSIAATELGATA